MKQDLEDELNKIEGRLDRHLEIYAQNGKESKRVADALERLIEHSKERDAKVDEMYEFFYGGHVVTRVAKVAGTFIMACGGAYLMFKSILK
jgi:hypothetical protein